MLGKRGQRYPRPTGDETPRFKALIFDSYYDNYRGVIVYIRVVEGTVRPGDTIRMMATGAKFTVVGLAMRARSEPCPALRPGEVGYCHRPIKDVTGHARGRHDHRRRAPPRKRCPATVR